MKKTKNGINFSVVIPNFNGEDLLIKNVPSLISAAKYKVNRINEIIIVDDHSTDSSIKIIQEKFPQVKLVRHKENRGFSSAVNTGVRTASENFVVLLNTDVKVYDNFLEPVIKHFRKKDVFAVSLHEIGYGWSAGGFENGFLVHSAGRESKEVHTSFWASGGSAVFRREMWMKLKGMDEELYSPFYWEDVDLSYRAQKRGWLIYWEPDAVVEHKHESTMSKIDEKYRRRIQERNHLLFNWKNLTSEQLMRKHFRGLLKRIISHPGYIRVLFMALAKIKQVRILRKIEKKESKVSDEAVLGKF